jgi:CRP-like cAMP-binding protein
MALEDDLNGLQQIALFQEFEPDALRSFASEAETRVLRVGESLFRRGDSSDCGYILTNGSIALETGGDGRPDMILQPFALIGEIALIASTTRPITATAREPTTVLKAPRALFHRVLEEHPLTAARVRALFAKRIKGLAQELKFDPSS